MVEIHLKNSRTRRVERLRPMRPGKVSMYLCGPTVYDRAHIGNARSAVVFDQLFRLLRHEYGPENVTFVRNFTDVDDKINARAAELAAAGDTRPADAIIAGITAETSQWYLDDMGALGVLEPTHMPRATAHISEMIVFIEDLIARGHAYAADGHVLFRVRSFADYGKLSGRSVDDMIAGARVEIAPYKEDPMDFVLWKPSSDDIPGWDSPWGRGRPGWHIECSAMSHAILGEEFDIHAGGSDLLFPHHENEVAQSCAAGHAFARIWIHNEMLQVEGKKMSKSLGNFFTVRDLLDKGVPGEVIRFVFLGTHYGKPMDWTEKKVADAEKTLRKWYAAAEPGGQVPETVVAALADDLNTHAALAEMHRLDGAGLGAALSHLGLWDGSVPGWAEPNIVTGTASIAFGAITVAGRGTVVSARVQHLADRLASAREKAIQSKDFSEVDALKQALVSAGVEVRMSKEDVDLVPGPDFDPSKLEGL